MTLKLKCFYCDSQDFGEAWETLTQDTACQDSVFSTCFRNQTLPGRQTTEVIDLIRSCEQKCKCSDEEGWCVTPECKRQTKCCWGQVYCEEDQWWDKCTRREWSLFFEITIQACFRRPFTHCGPIITSNASLLLFSLFQATCNRWTRYNNANLWSTAFAYFR